MEVGDEGAFHYHCLRGQRLRRLVQNEGDDYEKRLEANGERYSKYVRARAERKGVKMTGSLRRGSIYGEISQAHRDILLHARCSVLVVKDHDVDRVFKRA